MTMSGKSPVLIYRDTLLPRSETFVLLQGERLRTHEAWYVGTKAVAGLRTPPERTCLLFGHSRLETAKRAAFKLFGCIGERRLREILAIRPSLIHGHFGTSVQEVSVIARRLNIPYVVTVHGFEAALKSRNCVRSTGLWGYALRGRPAYLSAGSIIAVSEFIRSQLIDMGIPKGRIIRHYIGVDVDGVSVRSRIDRQNKILFVGRMVEKKGVEYLLSAVKLLHARKIPVGTVIVGDGPLLPNIMRIAQEIQGVEIRGPQDHSSVLREMETARILCVPSVTARNGDTEGLPTVIMEAFARGTPVVAFRHAGIPEIVDDEDSGLLYGERDIDGLADGLSRLITDDVLWDLLSRGARSAAETRFNMRIQSEALETIYSEQTGSLRGT